MVGLEKAKHVADISGGSLRGRSSLYVLCSVFRSFLFTLFGLSFLPLLGSATIEGSGAGLLRGQIARVFLFVSVASLVAAPILVHAALNLDDFFSRSSQVSVFHSSLNLGDALRILLINVWEHLLAFGVLGDRYWWQNLPGHRC